MKLIDATTTELAKIMAWFPDQRSCLFWGGPKFRFPFTETTFFEDARVDSLPSYALIGSDRELLGFGQYYERVGRCHLARLVVAPDCRRQGIGRRLIVELVKVGSQTLSANECSLFVRTENLTAIRLYEKLGFAPSQYPENGYNPGKGEYRVAQVQDVIGSQESPKLRST